MQAPPLLKCGFFVNIGFKGYKKVLNIIYEGIEGLNLDVSNETVYLEGKTDPIIFISKLYKARRYVQLCRLDYGYEENPEETRKPNSHFMRCWFKLNTLDISWYKRIIGALKAIQGLSLTIDALKTMPNSRLNLDPSNVLVYLQGAVDPIIFISNLYKARFHVRLDRIDYGFEENPEGIRKPNSHFTRCWFELNTSDISWYMKLTGVLKAIQGVSFTIDAQPEINAQPEMRNHMAYLCGNVEIRVLMKMLARTGIEPLKMEYGVKYKDANMNIPPKKLDAPANGTETQTAKDTESSPPEVVKCTSKKHQVIYKKPRGLRRFLFK